VDASFNIALFPPQAILDHQFVGWAKAAEALKFGTPLIPPLPTLSDDSDN
jgi:hypothetical protein